MNMIAIKNCSYLDYKPLIKSPYILRDPLIFLEILSASGLLNLYFSLTVLVYGLIWGLVRFNVSSGSVRFASLVITEHSATETIH